MIWEGFHQKVLDEVINCLKFPEIISSPNFTHLFLIRCDESQKGLEAALYQKINGKIKIISFASLPLSPFEKNNHLHSGKLEFLAVTEKFFDNLNYGPLFEVFTNNNTLTFILTSAKLNGNGLR